MIQIELSGKLVNLVCDKGNSRICFASTEGEGFDAETVEELLQGAGIISLSSLDRLDVEITVDIKDK